VIAHSKSSELAIVITGLPASGKTTVGRKIAERLGLDCLDKDDFLEALFESEGVGNLAWRPELSTRSNADFKKAAKKISKVVLISHWRPLQNDSCSGTPTDWVVDNYRNVIEVYCHCSVDKSVNRFCSRSRHPGHCDTDRSFQQLTEMFREYAQTLPLQIGKLVRTDTTRNQDIDQLTAKILGQL